MKRTLVVMAKLPEPGRVKTRLAAETSPEWAAQLAQAMLADTLERVRTLSVRRVVAIDPPEAVQRFQVLRESGFEVVPQADGDLGRRMISVLKAEFQGGASAVVLLGADSPSLPTSMIAQAFAELARADVVLGPSMDGGYYLLGCTRLIRELFDDIAWGTPDVLRQTVERLAAAQARLALLPPWYDIDTLADCRLLQAHLAALQLAGTDLPLPETKRVLGVERWA